MKQQMENKSPAGQRQNKYVNAFGGNMFTEKKGVQLPSTLLVILSVIHVS